MFSGGVGCLSGECGGAADNGAGWVRNDEEHAGQVSLAVSAVNVEGGCGLGAVVETVDEDGRGLHSGEGLKVV